VLRKANCAVVLATQSISDAERSGIIDVLKESCPTKICLPNGAAREPGTREFYERIGFNERQIEIVATPCRSANTTSSRRTAGACSTWRSVPVALAFVGASGKEDLKRIRRSIAEHGGDWPVHWLQAERNRRCRNAFSANDRGRGVGCRGSLFNPSPALPERHRAGDGMDAASEQCRVDHAGRQVDEQINNQITQISQLAEQIQNQLRIYENMLQNTLQLPNHIWGQVENDLNQLRSRRRRGRASPSRWAMPTTC
jgi:hypothetical protein